jgi:FkbM family methyltransferase
MVFDTSMKDVITEAVKNGEFMWTEEAQYIKLLSDKGFLLDVGANIGAISMLFAAKGWSGLAIEASEHNRACLRKSIILNNADFRIGAYAVSDFTGKIRFFQNGPWSSVVNDTVIKDIMNANQSFEYRKPIVSIPAYCLDDWENPVLGFEGVSKIDFIKMDIEGSEYSALRGMRKFLRHFNNPPIFSEVNGYNLFTYKKTPKDLFDLFEELCYFPYKLKNNELFKYDTRNFQVEHYTNYLFIHESDITFNQYKSEEYLYCDEKQIAAKIAFNIKNGYSQLQKYTLYALNGYRKFLLYPCVITEMDAFIVRHFDDEIAQKAFDWYLECRGEG